MFSHVAYTVRRRKNKGKVVSGTELPGHAGHCAKYFGDLISFGSRTVLEVPASLFPVCWEGN